MASKVDIFKLALSNIGHKATITDPDERSVEGAHCRTFYPIALAMTLERYGWSFATRRKALALVDNPIGSWTFAYALPAECIKPRKVLLPGSTDDAGQPFILECDEDGEFVLYTNVENAVLVFTVLVADTSKFTPMFVVALSYDLASFLVGPIVKDMRMKQAMTNAAAMYVGMAEASDANSSETSEYKDFIPAHMKVR